MVLPDFSKVIVQNTGTPYLFATVAAMRIMARSTKALQIPEKIDAVVVGETNRPSFQSPQNVFVLGMNDGVYTYHADGIKNDDDTEVAGLCDETFAGTIRVCSVPPAVLALSREKSQWEATHSGELSGALASESFNGYSYTLKTGKNGGALTWFDTPAGKTLERWRRPFV